jgi:hypothetical protein
VLRSQQSRSASWSPGGDSERGWLVLYGPPGEGDHTCLCLWGRGGVCGAPCPEEAPMGSSLTTRGSAPALHLTLVPPLPSPGSV